MKPEVYPEQFNETANELVKYLLRQPDEVRREEMLRICKIDSVMHSLIKAKLCFARWQIPELIRPLFEVAPGY